MTKKKVKKRSPRKDTPKKDKKDNKINEVLVENFVNLQKVLTNLSVKFEDLSDKISKLLQLFEISAKSFAEKHPEEKEDNNEFAEKLDVLLDQNKTIARGLTMLEEKIRERRTPRF